jgi:hypothetical protein
MGMGRLGFSVAARLLALLVLTSPAVAAGMFVPLKDYLAQPGIQEDPAALGYVMHRCSALYEVEMGMLEGETDPERQKLKVELGDAVGKFMNVALRLMLHGTTRDPATAQDRLTGIVTNLGHLYAERIEAAQLRSNDVFDDPLIASDLTVCKGFAEKIQAR